MTKLTIEDIIKKMEKQKTKEVKVDKTSSKVEIITELLRAEYGFSDNNKDEVYEDLCKKYKPEFVDRVLKESNKQRITLEDSFANLQLKLALERKQNNMIEPR